VSGQSCVKLSSLDAALAWIDAAVHPLEEEDAPLRQCGRGFFAALTRRRLQRGVFRSLVDLQAAINPLPRRAQP
jgi:hypothetical protein